MEPTSENLGLVNASYGEMTWLSGSDTWVGICGVTPNYRGLQLSAYCKLNFSEKLSADMFENVLFGRGSEEAHYGQIYKKELLQNLGLEG
jgi:hypothetical protein